MNKTFCRHCVYGIPPRDFDKTKNGHCKMMLTDFEYNAPSCYWYVDAREMLNREEKEENKPAQADSF